MKISQIPHEVAQNIAGHLTRTETLESLTVCSSLHFPMLEALYKTVNIDNTTVFRNFIFAVAHHRHKANLMVKKIELRFTKYTPGDQRMITFTEFELLARHCVNLNSISFLEFQHWKLMNELDFTQHWSRLRQIPVVYPRSNECLEVFHKIKDRLTEISIYGGLETHFSLLDLASNNGQFRSIKIEDRGASVNAFDIQQIHSTSNQLESLVLLTNAKPLEGINTALVTSLKHFECAINHPNSAWFNLCRTWYRNIDSLAIKAISWESRPHEDKSLAVVDAILLLFHETSIRKIRFDMTKNHSFMLLAENVITEVVFKCIEWNIQSNFALTFIYAIDTVMSEGAPNLQCTLSRLDLQQFCIQSKISYLSCKVESLEQLIIEPIGSRLTHLTLSHKITRDYIDSGLQSTPVFLDRILDNYTHLKSLAISVQVTTEFPNKSIHGDWFIEVALSGESNFFNTTNLKLCQLEQIEISSAEIDWTIYPYLFRRCRNLSSIVLKECNLQDEETLLALEYLCLANNVRLSIQ